MSYKKFNIALSALHQNTQQCIEISNIVQISGHEVCFITDDSYTARTLPKDKTLILKSSINRLYLKNILNKSFTRRIYERDRFIKKRITLAQFYRLADQWANELHDYFIQNDTSVLVIEGTPAYELIAEHIANRLGIKIACPAQLFYNGISHGILYSNSTWSDAHILEQKSELLTNENASIKDVISYQNKSPTLIYRISNFIKPRSINSPKRYNQLLNYVSKYLNYFLSFHRTSSTLNVNTDDNITFFMHVDPEKSVDNAGSDIWPQLEMITDLRRRLPVEQQLVVRDHPHLGRYRSYQQVRDIKRLSKKNTMYLNGRTPKDLLLAGSTGIATISGTIAIEAAQIGIPVLCYGKPIYLAHRYVFSLDSYDDFIAATKENLSENALQQMNREFESFIMTKLSSFSFGDVHLLAAANNFDNNASIARSIISLLEYHS